MKVKEKKMPRSCGTFLTVLMSMGFGAYVHHCLMLFTQDLNTSSHSSQANTFVRNVIKTVVKPAQALEELELLFQTSPETYHKTKRPPLIESPLDGVNSIPWRSLYDVVTKWCPDDPEIPKNYKETLQHFNYMDPAEMEMALRWREANLPFKVFNIPDITRVVNLWTDDYLLNESFKFEQVSSNTKTHVEISKDNHFMFFKLNPRTTKKGYTPPQEIVRNVTYSYWLQQALRADRDKLHKSQSHTYFNMNAPSRKASQQKKKMSFIARDLPMFSDGNISFFKWDWTKDDGIQCRLGMRGVIAESHFDGGRNMIAMLKGAKRYIINPPHECDKLGIIASTKHPSYRHSYFDWSDPSQAKNNNFTKVTGIDTIVRAGEVLYMPSYWFHYIISLDYSMQCNSRSGEPQNRTGWGWEHIQKCFEPAKIEDLKEREKNKAERIRRQEEKGKGKRKRNQRGKD